MELGPLESDIRNIRARLIESIERATDRSLADLVTYATSPVLPERPSSLNIQPTSDENVQDEQSSGKPGQPIFILSEVCRSVLLLERLGDIDIDETKCYSREKGLEKAEVTLSLGLKSVKEDSYSFSNAHVYFDTSRSVNDFPVLTKGNVESLEVTRSKDSHLSFDSQSQNEDDDAKRIDTSLKLEAQPDINKTLENRCTQTDSQLNSLCIRCDCPEKETSLGNKSRMNILSSLKPSELGNCNLWQSHSSNELSTYSNRLWTSCSALDNSSVVFQRQTSIMFDIERRRSVDERSWSSVNTLSAAASSISDNNFGFGDTCFHSQPSRGESKILNNDVLVDSSESVVRLYAQFTSSLHRGPCVIPDIQLLPDNRIVLTDHYHCNIQLYGEDLDLQAEVPCNFPMGLTCVNSCTIAVNLRRNKEVALFHVNESSLILNKVISVPCDFYIWNVVYKANNLYVVCDENNIHVFDCNETEFKMIPSNIPTERGYVRYFDVSDDGGLLYLCEATGLHCITSEGEELWNFTADQLPYADKPKDGYVIEDVCVCNGRLLATQWTSSRIFEISLSGHFVRNIIMSGIQNPRAISVQGKTIVVTQFHPTMKKTVNRTVNVFKIDFC